MSRRGTHRETRPAGSTGTPAEPTLSGPVEAVPNSARFDLSFCVLGIILIVCAMLLTFRFAMSPANARFLGMGDC